MWGEPMEQIAMDLLPFGVIAALLFAIGLMVSSARFAAKCDDEARPGGRLRDWRKERSLSTDDF